MGTARTFEPNLKNVILRQYETNELIFDEDVTRAILKFIFNRDHGQIDDAFISDKLREFAQALLIEAVDASYAMGYVRFIFDIFYMQPPKGVRLALAQLVKDAPAHWFKHATADVLHNPKIYENVRVTISAAFRSRLILIIDDVEVSSRTTAVFAYSNPTGHKIVWSLS